MIFNNKSESSQNWDIRDKNIDNHLPNSELDQSKFDDCYQAINKYTKNLLTLSEFKLMMFSTFKDAGDLGFPEQWREIKNDDGLPASTYYIMQLNVTNLPLDVRFGLCLPSQWTSEIINLAGDKISVVLSDVSQFAAKQAGVDLLIKYKVAPKVTFQQPETWHRNQKDDKIVAASVVVGVLCIFVLLAVMSSIYEQHKIYYSGLTDDKDINNNKNVRVVKNSKGLATNS